MLSTQTFTLWAHELGFAEVGFCTPEHFSASQKMVETQEPLAERRQLRFDPQTDDPQAKSIAVLLWPYSPACTSGDNTVFLDSYYAASNAAYHAARALEERILAAGHYAKANVSYPAKEAALRSGLGIIGKNSLLITPKYGTRIVIILMATDIEPPHFATQPRLACCISCGKCAQACPSGAITTEGMTHPERCLRNFMMEGVVVPEHLRPKIGMRLLGCDVCQRVCPMQPDMNPYIREPLCLDDFMTTDTAAFSLAVAKLADEIGRNTARPQRVRAQAALLAGSSKNAAYLPVLHQWAQMPFDAVREHALWAIRQIESETSKT